MDIESMNVPQLREALRAKIKQVDVVGRALGRCLNVATVFGPEDGDPRYPEFAKELDELNKIYRENV